MRAKGKKVVLIEGSNDNQRNTHRILNGPEQKFYLLLHPFWEMGDEKVHDCKVRIVRRIMQWCPPLCAKRLSFEMSKLERERAIHFTLWSCARMSGNMVFKLTVCSKASGSTF